MKTDLVFDFVADINAQNAREALLLEQENDQLKEENACLKLELEYYRLKELAGK